MDMNNNSRGRLQDSFELTAAALGNAAGITIRFGAGASTDGRTIVLPECGAVAGSERESLLGDLAHECGHLRFTDFSAEGRCTALEHEIDNTLEDVRIELAMGRLYRGAERLFRVSQEEAVQDFTRKVKAGSVKPLPMVCLHLLSHAEWEILGRTGCRDLAGECRTALSSLLGGDAVTDMEAVALRVRDARSTAEVIGLRREIMKILKKAAKRLDRENQENKEKQEKQEGSRSSSEEGGSDGNSPSENEGRNPGSGSAAGGEGSAGSSQSSPKDGAGRSGPDSGRGKGKDSVRNASQETSCGNGSGASGSAGLPEDAGSPESFLQAMRRAGPEDCRNPLSVNLMEHVRSLTGAGAGRGAGTREVMVDVTGRERPSADTDIPEGLKRIREARAASSALRYALSGLMRGEVETRRFRTEAGMDLDTSALAGVAVGDWRVFERRTEQPGESADVEVLLDLSGSMGSDGSQELALGACLGLISALEPMERVSCGLSVFPAIAAGCTEWQRKLGCITILGHGERLRDKAVAGRIGALKAYGGTPIGAALKHAVLRLSSCASPRKVIFVVTDGYVGLTQLAAADELQKRGWKVYGLLIHTDLDANGLTMLRENMAPHFSDCAVISDLKEIKDALFRFARSALVRRRGPAGTNAMS